MWSLAIADGASTEAARAGVGLVITQTYGRSVGNQHRIRQLASRRTDGIVLVDGGREGAASLLALRDRPTAIFAGSDEQARGVYVAAAAAGLRVPEDLSVVGFDDVALCDWVSPPLTTVRQPPAEMTAEATRLVLALSDNGEPPTPPAQGAADPPDRARVDSSTACSVSQRHAYLRNRRLRLSTTSVSVALSSSALATSR